MGSLYHIRSKAELAVCIINAQLQRVQYKNRVIDTQYIT
jgi:hypothetical protein